MESSMDTKEARLLKEFAKWLLWAVAFTAFGYWWAWEAMRGRIS